MPFSFEERPDSRQSRFGNDSPSLMVRYLASGETDDGFVGRFALGATPLFITTIVGVLYRQEIQIDPDGYARYIVTVPYGFKKKDNGSYSFTFDTTGATVKIKASKEHIQSYPTNGNPHKCSIGVNKDGEVEGCDIIIPALKLNVQFRHPEGVVDIPFAKKLAGATGQTNGLPFLTFAAGELLYLGSSGSDGSEADAEVAYQFAASVNATGISFAGISNIVKGGHHYAWVEFKDAVDSGTSAVQPKAVHVERVYDAIDFASVFGWGN